MPIVQPEASQEEEKIEDLKGFIRKERDARQLKKALAVKLSYQGYSYEAIVGILDVSVGGISKWKKDYEREGIEGLKPRHKGRQSYLTKESKQEVIKWLESKKMCELSELEYQLAEKYDVVYQSKQSYYDLLEEAGLSWKKTSKVNPKADAKAVSEKKLPSKSCWHRTARRLKREN
ncbi:MAG: winged helix-turn-helix domain-containing protein [Spirulinaceae cyanobacterium]